MTHDTARVSGREQSQRENDEAEEDPWLGKRAKPRWTLSRPFQVPAAGTYRRLGKKAEDKQEDEKRPEHPEQTEAQHGEFEDDRQLDSPRQHRISSHVSRGGHEEEKVSVVEETAGKRPNGDQPKPETSYGEHREKGDEKTDNDDQSHGGVERHDQANNQLKSSDTNGGHCEEGYNEGPSFGAQGGGPAEDANHEQSGKHANAGEVGGGPAGFATEANEKSGHANFMERLASASTTADASASLSERMEKSQDDAKKAAKEELRRENEERQRKANQVDYPNWWFHWRRYFHEMLAEFLATFVMLFIGIGSQMQTYTSQYQSGNYTQMAAGWSVGVVAGVHIAGGVSGGHLNPMISLNLCIFRGFPLRKFVSYSLTQTLAAFAAISVCYGLYADAINSVDPQHTTSASSTSTGRAFFTLPKVWATPATSFFSDFVSAALYSCITLAVGDSDNSPPGAGMHAFILGVLNFGIIASMGYNTGPQINPGKDIAARLIAAAAGYGREMWSKCWYLEAWVAAFSGGLFGCLVYDVFIYEGRESPVNYPAGSYSWSNMKSFAKETGVGLKSMVKSWSRGERNHGHMPWRKRLVRGHDAVDLEMQEKGKAIGASGSESE